MIDVDTFLTTLYVMVDEFCQPEYAQEKHTPDPTASLQYSEVITLAVFGQWTQFQTERVFYCYAEQHLRTPFPQLPAHPQFNRLMLDLFDAIQLWFASG